MTDLEAVDRRLARIESRLVQLMIFCGMPQGEDGQIEKNDKPGGIVKVIREYDRDTFARAASTQAKAATTKT